jgi:methyl-accepting chemotaxis protein
MTTEAQTKNSEFIMKAVENVTKQASEMTYSTREQSISFATAQQAKGSSAIMSAVENVTAQSSSVS